MTQKEFIEKFATAVLRAQELHENNYNYETGNYDKTHHQCAEEACTEVGLTEMSGVIYMLNFGITWNDIQAWAFNIQDTKEQNDE